MLFPSIPLCPGLSPRMRGNPARLSISAPGSGSIPAYAGEPPGRAPVSNPRRVYPRVCGGTWLRLPGICTGVGLSPRMRGNLVPHRVFDILTRSIPAYAGEPQGIFCGSARWKVYPRVCGGTPNCTPVGVCLGGLSPRMRGNPEHGARVGQDRRSIPAYAGEPFFSAHDSSFAWVYPRVCGGTQETVIGASWNHGLSPRMRGNLVVRGVRAGRRGSIPAYAGEPDDQ